MNNPELNPQNVNMDTSLPYDEITGDIEATRQDNGFIQTNVPWSVCQHSPDGFEFGYSGSGPADFALNILNLLIPPGKDGIKPVSCYKGNASWTAYRLHQEFKAQFIASMVGEDLTIPGTLIRAWMEQRINEILTEINDMKIINPLEERENE